jgi:hypothetical protein
VFWLAGVGGKRHITRQMSTIRMHRITARTWAIIATVIGALSLAMALSGEFETMLAWWMAIILLLPPLLWAQKNRYVSLKIICFLAFMTQFVSLPFFYFDRDNFAWHHVKPFGFTALDALPILSKVMLFLFFLIVFFKLLYRLRLFDVSSNPLSGRVQLPVAKSKGTSFFALKANYLKQGRYSRLYGVLIVLIIILAVPLNLWMYSQGISIVGVEAPKLPYRVSGILHYFAVFTVPLLLGFLYWKTKRNLFLAMILLMYAWILGLTTISRFALLIMMLPVLAFAWLDQRRWLLMVAGIGAVVGFAVVSLARNFVHVVAGNEVSADTKKSIQTIIVDIFTQPDSPFREADFMIRTFVGIFDRIDGFGNLVMSRFYDPNAVLSPLGFLLRMIWRPFAPLDVDLHHIQWQGDILPFGFYNGGALLSNTIIVGNASLLWIVASAFVAAFMLVLVEKNAYSVTVRYGLSDLFAPALIGFLAIVFFIENGGSITFLAPLLFLIITNLLSRLCRFNRPKSSTASTPTIHKIQGF